MDAVTVAWTKVAAFRTPSSAARVTFARNSADLSS